MPTLPTYVYAPASPRLIVAVFVLRLLSLAILGISVGTAIAAVSYHAGQASVPKPRTLPPFDCTGE